MEGEENYEYDVYEEITDEGTLYTMYRGSGEPWSETAKGQLVYQAVDDGNDLVFSKSLKKTLDYSEAAELFIFFTFINNRSLLFKGEIRQVKKIIDI
jgi:hypothetical protein